MGKKEDVLVADDDSSDVGDTVSLNDCDRLRHLLHVDHLVRSNVHSQPDSHYHRTLVSIEGMGRRLGERTVDFGIPNRLEYHRTLVARTTIRSNTRYQPLISTSLSSGSK